MQQANANNRQTQTGKRITKTEKPAGGVKVVAEAALADALKPLQGSVRHQ